MRTVIRLRPILTIAALLIAFWPAQLFSARHATVSESANVTIQTFIVQDKKTRPVATDDARLAVLKKGGIKKLVRLQPGKRGKGKPPVAVEMAVLVEPIVITPLAVDAKITVLARKKGKDGNGAPFPVARHHLQVTLKPSDTKLVNIFEYEPFGARIMAMVKAEKGEPVVSVSRVAEAELPSATITRSVDFDLRIERLDDGKQVRAETIVLHAFMGQETRYRLGVDVPTAVRADSTGQGKVAYAGEKAEISFRPLKFDAGELVIETHLSGLIHRAGDLSRGFPVDATETIRVPPGTSFELYATFGQKSARSIPPAALSTATGFIFHVTPRM